MTIPCLTCRAELDDSFKSCPMCGNEVSDFGREYSLKPVNGTYEILGRIRGGGMGEVFRARHLIFGTDFIIKVMKPALRDNEGLQKRFIREALLSRKVRHENVATIADAGRLPDGTLFIIAEFIKGTTFAHVIHAAGRLQQTKSLRISRQILSGLEAIHAAHLIHRDISPDNIMISPGEGGAERATIIDFGIAKQADGEYTMTESNLFLGKLRYASPEQLKADPNTPVDGRADLYSFGIMLYEMLTGNVPFSASSAGDLIAQQFFATPPPLPAGVATPALQAVVTRALEKSRNDRFQSAAEFSKALDQAITPAGAQIHKRIVSPPPEPDTTRVVAKPTNWKRAPLFVAVAALAVVVVAIILLGIITSSTPPIQQQSVLPASSTNSVVTTATDTAVTQTVAVQTAAVQTAAPPPAPKEITAGALQGKVSLRTLEPPLAALPGVSVKATVAGKSAHYDAVTDDVGRYRIEHMAPGKYDVEFSLQGFSPAKYENVNVRSDVLLNLDATMGMSDIIVTVTRPNTKRVAGRVPTSIVEPHE